MSELVVGSIAGLAANSYVVDVASGSTLDITNATGTVPSAVLPTGSVLQVVSTTKTDTFSTTSSSFVDITGLSVSITPRSTSSKILVMCSVMFGQSGDSAFQVQMVRDSTSIAVGDASSSRGRITLQHTVQGGDAFTQPTHSMTHLDSPSTTSATTYKLQARIDANTGYVNRTGNDADALTRGRGVSSITVMEIAG